MRNLLNSIERKMVARRETAALGARTLDDLGLDRDQLRSLARTPPAVMRRMMAMAKKHGIHIESPDMRNRDRADFARVCLGCRRTRECNAFLSRGATNAEDAGFCPNHRDFNRLAHADPGSR